MFAKFINPMKNSKGQNLVEAAILLPILLLIVFGIIEFGRIFSAYAIVNNTARDWTRRAAVLNYDAAELSALEADVEYDLSNDFGITAEVNAALTSDIEGDDAVELEIIHKVPLIAPIISSIIDDDSDGKFTITASCFMRYE